MFVCVCAHLQCPTEKHCQQEESHSQPGTHFFAFSHLNPHWCLFLSPHHLTVVSLLPLNTKRLNLNPFSPLPLYIFLNVFITYSQDETHPFTPSPNQERLKCQVIFICNAHWVFQPDLRNCYKVAIAYEYVRCESYKKQASPITPSQIKMYSYELASWNIYGFPSCWVIMFFQSVVLDSPTHREISLVKNPAPTHIIYIVLQFVILA